MSEMAENSGRYLEAGQFHELAELLKATHEAFNDFVYYNTNND